MLSIGKYSIGYAADSRIGNRERNEDSILAISRAENRFCFVVADGLGGHGLGDLASKTLTEVFAREFMMSNYKGNCEFLKLAFNKAQEEILALQRARGIKNQIKTTAVALSIIGRTFAWGHIGDSRLYHFRQNALLSRTLDHSVPQMLAMSNEITDEEIATHPDRSRLLRVVGDQWDSAQPQYEISKESHTRRRYAFLLCTDGIWEHMPKLSPPKSGLIATKTAETWLSAIMDETQRIGADLDNYSAVTVVVN
ncbi:MAG: protein phosphatase 2C domain-containing protein [Defluviitaleaceae bacterium]|nr:protein phosphatase 2C domain-containing protein [Defluviitaleaceae bacterium]